MTPYARRRSRVIAGRHFWYLLFACLALGPPVGSASSSSNTLPEAPEGCLCIGTVGNVNCDYRDEITLGDVTLLIDHLFISGVRLPNLEEANIDGDPAGEIGLVDVMMLIDHLFISGVALPDCPKPYNNPPETFLLGLSGSTTYINGVAPNGPATGVRMSWSANDLVDHPYDNPSFEFEYRMYGPYTDANFALLKNLFIKTVFITDVGQIFVRGEGWQCIVCDTAWLPGGTREITCDTVLIDTLEGPTSFGRIDSLFDIDDPDFEANPEFNRIAASSGVGDEAWTYATSDSLYSLFADFPSDTTVTANFVAWVRARDPLDSTVYDPTPDFVSVKVIEPKHERDIAVIDFGVAAGENRARTVSQRNFWNTAVNTWIVNAGLSGKAVFSLADDYRQVLELSSNNALLPYFLKHKVVVVVQDAAVSCSWSAAGDFRTQAFRALEVGTNVWVAARVPLGNHSIVSPLASDPAPADYQYYFGVVSVEFPGWGSWLFAGNPWGLPRTEDFVGANSLDISRWPNLVIDTALLHSKYVWEGSIDPAVFPYYPFVPEIGALPQVGWLVRTYDSEAMYTFKSLYGPIHPIDPRLSFDGRPVMIRLERERFRSAHSLFTPLALEATSAQQMVDSVLSWLYEKWLPVKDGPPVGSVVEGGK